LPLATPLCRSGDDLHLLPYGSDQENTDARSERNARPSVAQLARLGERLRFGFSDSDLPFALFRRGSNEPFRGGVAIGDQIVDLAATSRLAVFDGSAAPALQAAACESLNELMALGPTAWSLLRAALSRSLRTGSNAQQALAQCLVPQASAEYAVPARIGDYTDFYTSVHHATNIGRQFRPDAPLLPNYKWVPIGYHGRVSSIDVSGQTFPRPIGQTLPPGASQPVVGPCQRLDYELELGVFIGPGNVPGEPIAIADAEKHVFGVCLLNDWSARDIQAWEYQPLGQSCRRTSRARSRRGSSR
jgi:fumarylacetoacetase